MRPTAKSACPPIRRYFATTAAGIQPFAYAAYSEYFGNSVRAADVTYHFGNAPDTGGQILLGPGSPVFLFMQYQAMLMDDVSHSGTSPFTANTYSVNADGGIQSQLMFGFEKKF